MDLIKIGFGGGCHWCTESVFQALEGVVKVEQGWIASVNENDSFSEAVIVHFDADLIDLSVLIEIHLNTHSSTSDHELRTKYRSAVYTFSEIQFNAAVKIISDFQPQTRDFTLLQNYLETLALIHKYSPEGLQIHQILDIVQVMHEYENITEEKLLLAKLKLLHIYGNLGLEHQNPTIQKIL